MHVGLKPVHDATRVPELHDVPKLDDSQRHSVSVLQHTSPSHVADSPPTEPHEQEFRAP